MVALKFTVTVLTHGLVGGSGVLLVDYHTGGMYPVAQQGMLGGFSPLRKIPATPLDASSSVKIINLIDRKPYF